MNNESSSLSRETDELQPPTTAAAIPSVQVVPPPLPTRYATDAKGIWHRMFTEKPIVWIVVVSYLSLIVIGSLIIGFIFGIICGINHQPFDTTDLLEIVLIYLTPPVCIMSFIFMAVKWKTVQHLFRLRAIFSWPMLIGVLLLVPLITINFSWSWILQQLGVTGTDWSKVFDGHQMEMIVFVCLAPGLFEEIVFRGVIQTSLNEIATPMKSILMTSLLFAIIHITPASMPYIFLLSLVLCWTRQCSKSIWPPAILHILHNYIVTTVLI